LGPNKVPKLGKIEPDPAGGGTSALGGGAGFGAFFFGAARLVLALALVFFIPFFFIPFFLRAGAARLAFFFDFFAFFLRFFAMIDLPIG
jgi:hypothetical protein